MRKVLLITKGSASETLEPHAGFPDIETLPVCAVRRRPVGAGSLRRHGAAHLKTTLCGRPVYSILEISQGGIPAAIYTLQTRRWRRVLDEGYIRRFPLQLLHAWAVGQREHQNQRSESVI